ncbi:MAG: ribosome small subunit-dependent GTPase A [Candidatus Sumerlaeaceae bacterium]|nr:ribosome small subunit-dependent GTPase A [Candidatus Sumerlaeaceae bacterium]
MNLDKIGWDAQLAEAFLPHHNANLKPARVSIAHGGYYTLLGEDGELQATLAGKVRHKSSSEDWPVAGDWVAVAVRVEERTAAIQAVLPRRTKFSRKMAGKAVTEQVLAANVDLVFVAASLNQDFSPRRIERYIALALENGVAPVVLLTKSDLVEDTTEFTAEIEAISRGVPVHTVSALDGIGLEDLQRYLEPGKTAVILGSSGVGKSTLVNLLTGTDSQSVQEIREDGKGRHTTTRRELILLPGGGMMIDTPGIRELGMWEGAEGVRETFEDIQDLAARCKFGNCRHESEPGCAVLAAVEGGSLSVERFDSYCKLSEEVEFLASKKDELARQTRKKSEKSLHKLQKNFHKLRGR